MVTATLNVTAECVVFKDQRFQQAGCIHVNPSSNFLYELYTSVEGFFFAFK